MRTRSATKKSATTHHRKRSKTPIRSKSPKKTQKRSSRKAKNNETTAPTLTAEAKRINKIKTDAATVQTKYPFDRSILGAVMASGPLLETPAQVTMLVVTTALLLVAPVGATYMINDTRWDVKHGLLPASGAAWDTVLSGRTLWRSFEASLGLTRQTQGWLLAVSAAPLGILLVLDLIGPLFSAPAATKTAPSPRWKALLPSSLYGLIFLGPGDCDCYSQMFSESGASGDARRRAGCLVASPGNTYSNYFYYVTAAYALASNLGLGTEEALPFQAVDILFGVVVLVLAVMSTGWHAINRPVFHYPDLHTMECAIAFLSIRVPCSAAKAPSVCLALFLVCIVLIGKHKLEWHRTQHLHFGCPMAGRLRLWNDQHRPAVNKPLYSVPFASAKLSVVDVCLYLGLPVFYLALPVATQVLKRALSTDDGAVKEDNMPHRGSIVTNTIAVGTLVVGWSYRILERFCLDGNPAMTWVLRHTAPDSTARVLAAAAVSPTAILHWTTGLTLLFGYATVRSFET